jgi:hypothetical protein
MQLRDNWCDTTTPVGRLMLTIMGGIEATMSRRLNA